MECVDILQQPTLGRGRGIKKSAGVARPLTNPGASKVPEENVEELKRLAKKTNKKLRQVSVCDMNVGRYHLPAPFTCIYLSEWS